MQFFLNFIIVSILIFTGLSASALETVYPKRNPVTINSSSTFFVGSADSTKPLKINGNLVKLHKNGSFAYAVPLTEGENIFELVSGEDRIVFKITRPQSTFKVGLPQKFEEYETSLTAYIKTDRAPLRQTPIDAGINRMSHLQQGIPLKITGEKGSFYSVALDSKTTAWIAKNDVEIAPDASVNADFAGFEQDETREATIYRFHLSKKVPFTIDETPQKLTLKLFNIENQPENTYSFETTPKEHLFGYDGYFDENDFVFFVRKFPEINKKKPLKDIKIALDAGHGGSESGAIGCLGNKEKDINLEITKKLRDELNSRGADVIMTRDTDVNVSLKDRVRKAETQNSAILLSIHSNALPDCADPLKHRGTSVYYYYNQAKPLAENILAEITKKSKTQNDKVRRGSLALVRSTKCVSALIEVGYMINPDDNALLIDEEFQENCAKSIADGIERWLLSN